MTGRISTYHMMEGVEGLVEFESGRDHEAHSRQTCQNGSRNLSGVSQVLVFGSVFVEND